MDLGKITITKNKDCDNNTYYTAKLGETHLVGGGDTRNGARDELIENIIYYIEWLNEEKRKQWQTIVAMNEQLITTEKALKLAVEDKCTFENKFYSMAFGIANGKLACPKKEEWYLEQAKKEKINESVCR